MLEVFDKADRPLRRFAVEVPTSAYSLVSIGEVGCIANCIVTLIYKTALVKRVFRWMLFAMAGGVLCDLLKSRLAAIQNR